MSNRKIFCACCERDVIARLTDGGEIYPHRPDLKYLPFWKCDDCGNFVGCHHKTKDRTRPLGCIPTPGMKELRKQIHAVLDPIWQRGCASRKAIYREMSVVMGFEYHTAHTRSIAETENALAAAKYLAERHENNAGGIQDGKD